jgi:2-keto-4-pentenoate hydratase
MMVNEGRGRDGQGRRHSQPPLEALVRLAIALATSGRRLKAGEFVLLGSVGEIQWFEPGDQIRFEIGSLGRASRTFTR